MVSPRKSDQESDWVDDQEFGESEIDLDENYDIDEPVDAVLTGHRVSRRDYQVPLWRLIEMCGEDRQLQMELADFGDYDDFESFDGRFMDELFV
jgi:hypothetical protein